VVVKKRSVRLAVDRNWLKRRIRESYRQLRPSLQSECLLVVLARREALSVSQAILQETLRHSLEEASVLVRG
jgi:ribonuclease P protein component